MANPTVPVLNSPIAGVKIADNTPALNFTIPSDTDNNNLVFQIELDTNNPISQVSSDYKKFESRLQQGVWQYWNGSSYVDIPSGGIRSIDYGKDAVFTVPNINRLRNSIWYWKVSASDQMGHVLFGTTATFAQAIFGGS